MQVKALDHIHIYSRNPEASQAFWERHFSAKQVFTTKNAHHQEINIYQVGNQRLAFSAFPPGHTPSDRGEVSAEAGREGMGPGGMHLGINVVDVKAAAAELSAAGVKVHTDPAEAYGVTFVYVEAPDGVMIELTQY